MVTAITVIGLIALVFGALLGYAAIRFRVEGDPIVDKIDALLPQTQCGQCGYPGCRPYAEAMSQNLADINCCPPGGETTINNLAELLGCDSKPLDPERGEETDLMLAVIDEEVCIGCTLCIQDCPVDAILGGSKQMHTVIAEECTGCELCIAPCPVDCIDMVPVSNKISTWKWPSPSDQLEIVVGS